MDNVIASQIEAIRAAFADGASAPDTIAGATACRTLLAVLDAQPGQPLGTTQVPAATPLATALGQLGQLNVDQVLDLVILKLRTMVPTDASRATTPSGFQLPILPLPGGGTR